MLRVQKCAPVLQFAALMLNIASKVSTGLSLIGDLNLEAHGFGTSQLTELQGIFESKTTLTDENAIETEDGLDAKIEQFQQDLGELKTELEHAEAVGEMDNAEGSNAEQPAACTPETVDIKSVGPKTGKAYAVLAKVSMLYHYISSVLDACMCIPDD